MTTVYNLCKLLIDRGRTDGLQDKMDVYLAADRLTPEEYQKLAGLLAPTPEKAYRKPPRPGGKIRQNTALVVY